MEVLVALGRAAEARPVAERLISIAQKEFPNTDEASTAADDLGMVCSALGDYQCGLRAYETAIAITRKISGNNSPDLLSPLNNLGALKFDTNDMNGSIAADEEALAIAQKTNPNSENIGVIEDNLGAHYIRVRKFDKALEHLNRAVFVVGSLVTEFGDRPASSLTKQELAKFLDSRGRSPATFNRYRATLSMIYREAIRMGWTERNPARLIEARKENNARIRFLSDDEEDRLRNVIETMAQPGQYLNEFEIARWK